jgi:membrane protein
MAKIKDYLKVLKNSFGCFIEDNAFKLSASLSYYTIFSLGPVLIIVISLAGFFFGQEAVQGRIFWQIQGLVGKDAAIQIQEIIKNTQQTGDSTTGTIIGILLLVVGATGVFIEIQDSINYIWSVKAKPKKGWLKFLKNRLLSFSLIVSMGFILLVSLIVSAMLTALSDVFMKYFSDSLMFIFHILNFVIILAVITLLFAVIFKVLPDAHMSWKDTFIGAGFTAFLFILGKFAINFYLTRSDVGSTYGAAASIVILLTWIYYSSLILYFGAEFTKINALSLGKGIKPNENAVYIVRSEAREAPHVKEVPRREVN